MHATPSIHTTALAAPAAFAQSSVTVFGLIFRWGLKVANRAPDRFSRLLAAGMTMTIFFYMCINLMMVMGLAPVVGVPMPLLSNGGTVMLTVIAMTVIAQA
mgnify:CR=1 FL=1